MLANAEIRALVVAIGTAIGEEFDIAKLRYHKVVIMTDADVDGAHIRTLLLTLFYRHFRKVVEGGYIYIAQPPLFRIQLGKAVRYAFSDPEKEKIMEEMSVAAQATAASRKKDKIVVEEVEEENSGTEETPTHGQRTPSIQRYKGLGEMNASQLWETTMDPEHRLMKQVTIEDAEQADKFFDILMGDDVAPRKNFIQTHASTVQNLDV